MENILGDILVFKKNLELEMRYTFRLGNVYQMFDRKKLKIEFSWINFLFEPYILLSKQKYKQYLQILAVGLCS